MSGVIVETRYGPVLGSAEAGIARFFGIPYAAPPVGPGRFAAASDPSPWVEVRSCDRFLSIAPQGPPSPTEFLPGDPIDQSEDCLWLNVWAPWSSVPAGEPGRPVMVYVHGGGFASGSGALSLYRGDPLARHGVVVVTFNYRLGLLGWLAHPHLADDQEDWANFGLSDQVAALRWVNSEISRFGGDPANVTVFGESAGAMAVAALLASPAAAGTFARAVMQSGAALALGTCAAAEFAEEVAGEAGLDKISVEGLREIPVGALLEAQFKVGRRYEALGLPLQPVVDGRWLERHPASAIAAGAAAGVDVMIGTNRDEWRFFTFTSSSLHTIDFDRLLHLVSRHIDFAGLTDEIEASELIEEYRAARAERNESTSAPDLYTAIGTDWVFRVPAMRLAEAQSKVRAQTFAYLFDWESPFGGGVVGSCHALELPFVFGTLDHPLVAVFAGSGPAAATLSETMQESWVAFARLGDPSCERVGDWPAYENAHRSTMRLGAEIEVLEEPMEAERAWLSEALGEYGVAEAAGLERVRRVPLLAS